MYGDGSFPLLNVDKGYDSENARRKGEVQLYSLVYDKRNGEFFSLPEVTGGGHPESPLIAAGLQEDLPFWPNLNLNGDPAFVVGKAVLENTIRYSCGEMTSLESLMKPI